MLSRKQLDEAVMNCDKLADGITQLDREAIVAARALIRRIGESLDENIQVNALRAVQEMFLEWAAGPVEDLHYGLKAVRLYALKHLKYMDP